MAKSHDRSVQPVVERGQELNTEHAQIRTLLDRQREQILPDCPAEIRKTIESQQEVLHRAQAEDIYRAHQGDEQHRRDQQLLHEQLLKQNWDLREAHEKSLSEIEELKRFQGSTFDEFSRRRLVEDRDTIL